MYRVLKMNDKHDEINNALWERYRSYLEGLTGDQLIEIISDMPQKQLIDIIQEADPVGKGDGYYE